jgi:hypothetical protein
MIKYTVYKTVNKVNGKFYIGVHKTDNPNDGYLGSGTYIERAVQKYGASSFVKEILFEYETQEEAWAKENELVESNRSNPLCKNLRKGGSGGFDYLNKGISKEEYRRRSIQGNQILKKKLLEDPVFRSKWEKDHQIATARLASHRIRSDFGNRCDWTGRKHTEVSKQIMSEVKRTDSLRRTTV